MYYSLPIGEQPIYELDENGNKIIDYVDEEGNIYYRETGESEMVYSAPILFENGISGRLSEVLIKEFGIDDSSMYAEMSAEADKYPIVPESIIWKNFDDSSYPGNQILPSNETLPSVESLNKSNCDYIVVGVINEGLNVWKYLLRRNLK